MSKVYKTIALSLSLAVALFVGQMIGVTQIYAQTDISPLTAVGDTTTKQYSEGSEYTFTANVKASYTVQLKGPASSANGGIVTASMLLDVGDTLDIYLGPSATAATGARDGKAGTDGSGYGDTGIFKSVVKYNGNEVIVAGGGGGAGNPGTGNSELIQYLRPGHSANSTCPTCGYYNSGSSYTTYHYFYKGIGGVGGAGGTGGGAVSTPGKAGSSGSSARWDISDRSFQYNYAAGGAGGNGGAGGASYVDLSVCLNTQLLEGTNPGESSVTITMGEETLPTLDAALLYQVKEEIVNRLEKAPVYTVVSNTPFDFYSAGYSNGLSGSNCGVTVSYETSGSAVRVQGKITESAVIIVGGYQYVFNAIQEPNSSNVLAVFN